MADSRGQWLLTKPLRSWRAVFTRKPDSDKAKALASQGVQMVAADLDDEESLEQAFAGASAAFCVTNYWEHFSPERELAQAGNMAKAAKAAGLEHVIWSRSKIRASGFRSTTTGCRR